MLFEDRRSSFFATALFAALAPTLHLGGYRLAAKVRSGPTVLYVWEDAGRV